MMDLITTAALIMLGKTGGSANLTTKTITENGTYYPEDGYDGFEWVKVDIDDRYNEGHEDGWAYSYRYNFGFAWYQCSNDEFGTAYANGGVMDGWLQALSDIGSS